MIVLVSGVSGSGKSTVGRRIASKMGWRFYDADDFHSQANIEKMSKGVPLTDEDRLPWLQSMAAVLRHCNDRGENAVLACSALKRGYRDILLDGIESYRLIFLKAPTDVLLNRLQRRKGHFMKAGMLNSQFEALEEPLCDEAFVADATMPIEELIEILANDLSRFCKTS